MDVKRMLMVMMMILIMMLMIEICYYTDENNTVTKPLGQTSYDRFRYFSVSVLVQI